MLKSADCSPIATVVRVLHLRTLIAVVCFACLIVAGEPTTMAWQKKNDTASENSTAISNDLGFDGWESKLKAAISGVDRLIVSNPYNKKDLLEIQLDENDVTNLIDSVTIDVERSDFRCRCAGDYHFTFYRDGEKTFSLGYHHGHSLRWYGGPWKCDGRLTPTSQSHLRKWFDEKGFSQLSEDHERRTAIAKREKEEFEAFISAFPSSAKDVFRGEGDKSLTGFLNSESDKARQVAAVFDSKVDLGLACCRALGRVPSLWSSTGPEERIALEVGRQMANEDFVDVLGILQEKQDTTGLLGAARFFFYEDYLMEIPETELGHWMTLLAKHELESEVNSNKSMVIRELGRHDLPEVIALLHEIALGKSGRQASVRRPRRDPDLECSAFVALAMLDKSEIKEQVKTRLASEDEPANKAALQVCLVLSGDPGFISGEHFEFFSATLGFAAINGIENFKGKYGIDVLVESGLDAGYGIVRDEAVQSFQRLTEEVMDEFGMDKPVWERKKIQEWWPANKDELLMRMRHTR